MIGGINCGASTLVFNWSPLFCISPMLVLGCWGLGLLLFLCYFKVFSFDAGICLWSAILLANAEHEKSATTLDPLLIFYTIFCCCHQRGYYSRKYKGRNRMNSKGKEVDTCFWEREEELHWDQEDELDVMENNDDSSVDPSINNAQGVDVSTKNTDGHDISSIVANICANDEVIGMKFDSIEAAGEWYSHYSKHAGFGIRIRDSRRRENGLISSCTWVCAKEGTRDPRWYSLENRKRKPRAETRENCGALFRVKFDKNNNNWFVHSFVSKHCHPLVAPDHVQFLISHRQINEGDKAQANAMRNAGIKTCNIIEYLAQQCGGLKNMNCTPKDIYNAMSSEKRKDIGGGDAQRTLGYLEAKRADDPGFYWDYSLKDNKSLGNLFWADSTSRVDYSYFGDALAFDSCYKRNIYNIPLIVLVGVNNHRQSIIFGCALLANEKTESYIWLLTKFLHCMGDKKPISVITDGDRSMQAAIEQVLPNAMHRLCSWHLERNIPVDLKQTKFASDFTHCMLARMSIQEFEHKWEDLVEKYNLQHNEWVQKRYEDRSMWAEAFLKSCFFGGFRTTSRVEGMHSFLNNYLDRTLKLYQVVKQIGQALARMRWNECQADHNSTYGTPVCRHILRSYEKQGSEFYTNASFGEFQEQLNAVAGYKQVGIREVVNDGDYAIYKIRRSLVKEGHIRTVTYDKRQQYVRCDCMLLESYGFPCRHAIYVVSLEGEPMLPSSFFLKRWSKSAKSAHCPSSDIRSDVMDNIRYGTLTAKCNVMCRMASKSQHAYGEVSEEINRLTKRIEEMSCQPIPQTLNQNPYAMVLDPEPAKTKGTPAVGTSGKQQKKCSICRQPGHTRPRCPLFGQVNHTIVESNDETLGTTNYGISFEDTMLNQSQIAEAPFQQTWLSLGLGEGSSQQSRSISFDTSTVFGLYDSLYGGRTGQ